MKSINKSKVILTTLMIIFLVGGNTSAGLGKKLRKARETAKQCKILYSKEYSKLQIAIMAGNLEGAKKICVKYSNDPEVINYKNLNNETPLELALNWDSNETRRIQIAGKWEDEPVDSKNIRMQMIEYLVNEAHVNVNIPYSDKTPILNKLIRSDARNLNKVATTIIMAGADLNIVDPNTGETALEVITKKDPECNFNCNYDLITILLYSGANVNHINPVTGHNQINLEAYNKSLTNRSKHWPPSVSKEYFLNTQMETTLEKVNITLESFNKAVKQ